MENVAHFIFGIFGNATALFLFLAPIVTFRRILKKRSTEEFSGVPYNMTMLNCLLSAWYGLPFVSPNNLLVSTINGTGALIEAIYVLIFLVFAPKKVRAKMMGLLVLVLSVFASVALISVLALRGQPRKLFCGCAATIFSICMYASPLSIMAHGSVLSPYCQGLYIEIHDSYQHPKHEEGLASILRLMIRRRLKRLVIRTKSVEYMPFFLSLFVFLCGTSWFIYGLLGRDPFIAVPNGCGSALGAVQLILYAIYRKHKGVGTTTIANRDSVEMDDVKPAKNYEQNGEQV